MDLMTVETVAVRAQLPYPDPSVRLSAYPDLPRHGTLPTHLASAVAVGVQNRIGWARRTAGTQRLATQFSLASSFN